MTHFKLFFVDASFEFKTQASTIGIYDVIEKKDYSFITKASNSTEAEMIGMRKAMEIAQNEKTIHLAIVSDSKFGISKIKKEIYNERELDKTSIKSGFRIKHIQFLWIPREYNQLADMLSKNISEKDVSSLVALKENNIIERKDKITNKLSKIYVKDIKYSKNLENDSLSMKIKEFSALSRVYDMNEDNFSSRVFKMLLKDDYDLELIEDLIFDTDEIENLENDINKYNESNLLLSLSMSYIRDLLIFN